MCVGQQVAEPMMVISVVVAIALVVPVGAVVMVAMVVTADARFVALDRVGVLAALRGSGGKRHHNDDGCAHDLAAGKGHRKSRQLFGGRRLPNV